MKKLKHNNSTAIAKIHNKPPSHPDKSLPCPKKNCKTKKVPKEGKEKENTFF